MPIKRHPKIEGTWIIEHYDNDGTRLQQTFHGALHEAQKAYADIIRKRIRDGKPDSAPPEDN